MAWEGFVKKLGLLFVAVAIQSLFLVFVGSYWGLGTVLFGLFIVTTPFIFLTFITISSKYKSKNLRFKLNKSILYTVLICAVPLLIQVYVTRPKALKEAILPSAFADKFNAVKGRAYYPAFEIELYLQLQSDSTTIVNYLKTSSYKKAELGSTIGSEYTPEWWPTFKSPLIDYTVFEMQIPDEEVVYYALVGANYSTMYIWYLVY